MSHSLPHHGNATRATALLALISIAILTAGCDVSAPQMPTYNTTIALPLGSQRINVADAVGSSGFLTTGPDSSLGFHLAGDPDTLGLDFNLTVDIPAQTVNQGLGNFSLPAMAPLSYPFELGSIWPPATGATGITTFVPAFPITVVSTGQTIPDLTSAALSDGVLSITITNNLPVDVSADTGPDQIVVRIENTADSSLVATVSFPALPTGTSSTQLANLAGVTLSNSVSLRLAGGSPGSKGQLVTVNGTDAISIAASFTNLVVSSATAVVTGQTFSSTFTSPLPTDYSISTADVMTGSVDVTLTNGLPLSATALVTWDQVITAAGSPLTQSFQLTPGGSATSTLDFAGTTIQSGAGALTSLNATVDIVTPGSMGQSVTLNASDQLTAALSPGTMTFGAVTGSVPAFTVAISPIVQTIDLPPELSGIKLTAAALTLDLTTTAGLPADIALMLKGTAANGTTLTLPVTERIQPSGGLGTVKTTIVLDQTNSGILDFLNNLPETITLSGDVTAGGVGVVGTVSSSDLAVVGWAISAPVEVVITDATINSSPSSLNLSPDVRQRITDRLGSAVLHTEILNHLPMGLELRIVVAQDTTQLGTNPLLTIGPLVIEAAQVDPTTHVVLSPVTSTPALTLTAAQAHIFSLPGLYTRIEAILPATNGVPVAVMSNDYLLFQGVVELEVQIDGAL